MGLKCSLSWTWKQVFKNSPKTVDKFNHINYYNMAMRDWRNRQTRAFKGRMGDRVSSSLTSRTKIKKPQDIVVFLVFNAKYCGFMIIW